MPRFYPARLIISSEMLLTCLHVVSYKSHMNTTPTIKIEKGIPIPDVAYGKNGLSRAIKVLKPGDSFILPIGKRANTSMYAKRFGFKLISRKISDTEVRVWRVKFTTRKVDGGIRVWRVK